MLVAGLTLLGLLVVLLVVTERSGLEKDDTRHYVQMARDPAYLPRVPYAFRVLTPGIVHLLPFETLAGFTLVTLIALWLSAIALHTYCRALGIDRLASAAVTSLMVGSGATVRLLTTPTYVDALSYLFTVLALLALQLRKPRRFALVLAIGVLNRETILLLLPVYLLQLRAAGRLNRGALPRLALVCGLPLLTLGVVVAVKLLAGGVLESGLEPLRTKPRTFEQNVPSPQDLADIYSVFGAAWLLALLGWRRASGLLRRSGLYAALIVLQLGVSRGDESRNLSHLLPVVLPLAGLQLAGLGPARTLGVVVAGLASMVSFRWLPFPSAILRYGLVSGGTLAAVTIALIPRPNGLAAVGPASTPRSSGSAADASTDSRPLTPDS